MSYRSGAKISLSFRELHSISSSITVGRYDSDFRDVDEGRLLVDLVTGHVESQVTVVQPTDSEDIREHHCYVLSINLPLFLSMNKRVTAARTQVVGYGSIRY